MAATAGCKRRAEPIAAACSLSAQMASFLHTCYRIGDIDRSIAFYEKLGFEEMRRMPIGDEAINVFMGLPATRVGSS